MNNKQERIDFLISKLTGGDTEYIDYLVEYLSLVCDYTKTKKENSKERLEEKFNEFWNVYPVKKGKLQAKKAFEKINPNDKLFQEIITFLQKQIMYKSYCDSNNIFCPEFMYPQGWLNNERWTDIIEEVKIKTYNKPKNSI